MNLSHLYYFCKLAEVQHYTKAAQELYITQPSLSGAISSLESELGVELFQRCGRNIKLTKYGKEFYEYVSSALRELDKGVEALKEHSGKMGGTIELGSIPTIQSTYLPKVIQDFRNKLGGNVVVNVHLSQTNEIIAAVEEERWDIGFCTPVDDKPELFFVPVLEQPLMAAVRESHPLAKHRSLTFAQLAPYELISYQIEQPLGRDVRRLLKAHGVSADYHFSSEESLCGQIMLNDSVAIVLKTPGVENFPGICFIPLPQVPKSFRVVHLVFKKKSYKDRATESFIDFVSAFWSYDPPDTKWWLSEEND